VWLSRLFAMLDGSSLLLSFMRFPLLTFQVFGTHGNDAVKLSGIDDARNVFAITVTTNANISHSGVRLGDELLLLLRFVSHTSVSVRAVVIAQAIPAFYNSTSVNFQMLSKSNSTGSFSRSLSNSLHCFADSCLVDHTHMPLRRVLVVDLVRLSELHLSRSEEHHSHRRSRFRSHARCRRRCGGPA